MTNAITVVGPARPRRLAAASAASSAPRRQLGCELRRCCGTPGSASAGSGSKPSTVPGPVASAAVVSHSLPSALSKGLVVSYSVNEQVAGQFQVLLAVAIAKRIGLHGAPATGLPPGSPPSIVIAKAILVTTKGGRNTVKIQFGKKTAAKLRKLRKVLADAQADRPQRLLAQPADDDGDQHRHPLPLDAASQSGRPASPSRCASG